MLQKTIKKPVSCRGISLHGGKDSFLEFRTASPNSGIYFLNNRRKIPAHVSNVVDTKRGTSLLNIFTVEHVLAAVCGLNIANIEIFLDGEEPPALDGSSIEFVKILKSAGIEESAEERKILSPKSEFIIRSGDSSIELYPSDHLLIEATIDYSPSFIGKQSVVFDEQTNDFEKEIAPARTFGFVEEVEELKKAGLAKGACFENAIAISNTGYLSPLRMENELARHKILDIMGDIALAGYKITGKIVSHKAGHKLNVELVRRLLLNEPG